MERLEIEDDDDDIVCLDESFFINDNYQLTKFTFGSQVLELYCLHPPVCFNWYGLEQFFRIIIHQKMLNCFEVVLLLNSALMLELLGYSVADFAT